jgi:hypothetical protein
MSMEIQQFIIKRLEAAHWQHVPVVIVGLSSNCLLFKKDEVAMLIETGVIPKENKERARDKIRFLARQNAARYRMKCVELQPKIYYGHITNETVPRIKGLCKF